MRKTISIVLVLMLVIGTMAGCASKAPAETGNVELNWATISGFYTEFMKGKVAEFEAETGIKVNIIEIDNSVMYEKQGIEMASKTGAYDILTNESMWKAEWANAGYIIPIDDYIKEAGLEADLANLDPATFKLAGKWNGKVYALPYYSYNTGMVVRQDLFDDPTEKADFKAKYGVDLVVPTDWEYYTKVADFFTRPAGAMLKGVVNPNPMYGCGAFGGRFPDIQDENMGILWGLGGDVIDNTGKAVINSPEGVKGAEIYTYLLNNCTPPGAKSGSYDEEVSELQNGLIAMTGEMFLDQWANMVKTEALIPGAKVQAYEAPLKRGYIGAFGMSISAESKYPKEAFQFIAWLNSFENAKEFALAGGSPIRTDVMTDPEITSEANRLKTGGLFMMNTTMASQANVDPAIFKTPAAGKIYEEMMIAYNRITTGEIETQAGLDELAAKIDQLNKPYMNADFLKN